MYQLQTHPCSLSEEEIIPKYYNKLDLGSSEEEVRYMLERDGIDPGVRGIEYWIMISY